MSTRRWKLVPLVVVLALTASGSGAPAVASAPPVDLIVRYKAGVVGEARTAVRARLGIATKRGGLEDAELIRTRPGRSIEQAIEEIESDPAVLYAEPNITFKTAGAPNDTDFPNQWALQNTAQLGGVSGADVRAVAAWAAYPAPGASVTVAVADTGLDLTHPELVGRLWSDASPLGLWGTIVEGEHGADWVDNDGTPDSENGHGTHVSGIIAAASNNAHGGSGIAGTWNVKLMSLRVLDEAGNGSLFDIAQSFAYAADHGARVVNASLGACSAQEPASLTDAMTDHPNVTFVVAAGNGVCDADEAGDSVETGSRSWPCASTAPNMVCVGASTPSDTLASFSNYGATSVDLVAPGQMIQSTFRRTSGAGNGSTGALTDSPDIGYANNGTSWARLDTPVDLTGNTDCEATWDLRTDTEYPVDLLRLQAATDPSGPWTGIYWYTGSSRAAPPYPEFGGYLPDPLVAPIPAEFEGVPVYLRFMLETDATITDDGVYIDNLGVGCQTGPDPLPTQTFEGDLSDWTTDPAGTWARTTTTGESGYLDGTSMAAPMVAGAAAMLWAKRPSTVTVSAWSPHVRNVLLGSADPRATFKGKAATGARLNLKQALDCALDLTAPTNVKVPDGSYLGRDFQRSAIFTVTWTASSPSPCGIRNYDIRYRRARYSGSFGSYVAAATRTTATSMSFRGAPGYTYCFSVRARDRAYNSSGWSAPNCTAVAADDDGSGWVESGSWTHVVAGGYYNGDYTKGTSIGASTSLPGVVYRRLSLIATSCSGCGKVAVYAGTALLRTIDLNASSTTKNRQFSIVFASSTRGPSTIKIKIVRSGSVRIEGLGVSRV